MRRIARAALPVAAALAASRADAHLMNTGFGPFYDGLAHPLVTVEDLLPVTAMALLGGLGGARTGRWVLFTLPAAWLAGMVLGRALSSHEASAGLAPLLTVALGALVAADRKPPAAAVAVAAAVVGLVHGWQNGTGLPGATGLAGVACTIFIVVSLLSGGVVSLRPAWTRIAVRVAGSWIAAIGLLIFGWSLRKGAP